MSSQPFKRNHLQHALAVSHWMQANGAQGGLDPRSMVMEITLGEISCRFYPQFTAEQEGVGLCFVSQLQPGVNGFVGWYPFTPKAWPIAQSKQEFKRFCRDSGLRTPAWTQDLSQVKGAFLVKQFISSLGRGQRGPYGAAPGAELAQTLQLSDGEYAEQFIRGKLVKAWFWCEELAVVELIDMPYVQGNGKSTVLELMRQSTNQLSSQPVQELLDLQGIAANDMPAQDQRVYIDYQYMAQSNPALYADYNCRQRITGTAFESQLRQAGQLCWSAVPEDIKQGGCTSSLDGILDEQGRIWFLEVNCNPLLHPAYYDRMLNAIFKPSPSALS
jgi:hypothetical protein